MLLQHTYLNSGKVHNGWVCFTLSVACWDAAAAASLWRCRGAPDTSEEVELGLGWHSECSSKQADRWDQKDKGNGRRQKRFVREQRQHFHSSQQLVRGTAEKKHLESNQYLWHGHQQLLHSVKAMHKHSSQERWAYQTQCVCCLIFTSNYILTIKALVIGDSNQLWNINMYRCR